MASEVQRIPKPVLRSLFRSYLKKHLTIAILAGFAASAGWYTFVSAPRKKAYADFYKTYDPIADYERIKKLDVLPPYPEVERD